MALVLGSCTPGSQEPGPRPTTTPAAAEAAGRQLARELRAALAQGDRARAAALADPDHPALGRRLGAWAANAQDLGLTDVAVVFHPDDAREAALGGGRLRISWRLTGLDPGVASTELPVQLGRRGGRAVVARMGDDPPRVPLWLQGRVRVRRGDGWLVVGAAAGPRLGMVAFAARAAVRAVGRVLPRVRSVVVEVPGGAAGYEAALAATPGEYAALAAVTTTADGSTRRQAPVRVVVNPDQLARMRQRGVRVVLTHEAVHVATWSATADVPLWLSEGFADYVALRGSAGDDPAVTGALAAVVRAHGVPRRLPGDLEFGRTGRRLRAAYQGAWLACAVLVERAGEPALLEVRRAVAGGTPLGAALRRSTGWSLRRLVGRWRERLSHLPA